MEYGHFFEECLEDMYYPRYCCSALCNLYSSDCCADYFAPPCDFTAMPFSPCPYNDFYPYSPPPSDISAGAILASVNYPVPSPGSNAYPGSGCGLLGTGLMSSTSMSGSSPSGSSPRDAKNPQMCGECGKVFTSSSALAKHKLTHSDERRYSCKICHKRFKRQDHL